MVAAMAPPSGNGDIGFHQGVIQSWDELTGVNSILVNDTVITNVKTFQSGIGVPYFAGDVVGLFRFQSTYFILGKITAPGGSQSNQIKGQFIAALESTTSTTPVNLPTFGPSVTVNIGSSRRCLVISSCYMGASATNLGDYFGGNMRVDMTAPNGSTTTNIVGLFKTVYCAPLTGTVNYAEGFQEDLTRAQLLTAADGVGVGQHTFTAKYKATVSSVPVTFASRNLVVIPF
jgi:hypothetical protein